jgi:hypothetical protein
VSDGYEWPAFCCACFILGTESLVLTEYEAGLAHSHSGNLERGDIVCLITVARTIASCFNDSTFSYLKQVQNILCFINFSEMMKFFQENSHNTKKSTL